MFKKKMMLPLLLIALWCIQQPVSAQRDTSVLHFPRFSAPEQSVQSFTVTGEQLSRMPYTDLGQAIGVWMGPGLATGNNTVFVVDGTLVNDVNIYSIQDVATITFVQTGPAQLAGMTRVLQHLVLITTKRNTTGKWQWRVAGATAFVNRKDSAAKPGLYHQYNVSVSNGTEKLAYGASAGYTHDVFPQSDFNEKQRQSPFRQNRYRANAWLEAGVQQHRLRLDAAYVTQRHSSNNTINWDNGDFEDYDLLNKDRILNLKASVKSALGAGVSNQVIADFYDQRFNGENSNVSGLGSGSAVKAENHLRNWMVEERFSFQYHKHGHHFTAELDALYRHIDHHTSTVWLYFSPDYGGGSYSAQWTRGKFLYITPSVSWGVGDILNLQAGVLYTALKDPRLTKRYNPFASASFDLLHCVNRNSPVSLRMYASVARVSDFLETGWAKLTNLNKQVDLLDAGGIKPEGAFYNPYMVFDYSRYTRFQGGVRLGLLQNRVLADYSYDKSSVPALIEVYVPGGSRPLASNTPYVRHRVAVSVKTDVGSVNWTSVLSVNWLRSKPQLRPVYNGGGVVTGGNDFFTTAGFANRLICNSWFGALDLVGAFNKASGVEKRNTIVLQEAHLGRKFTSKATAFELYIFARTPFNNVNLPLADLRRYYGIGCTAAF